MTSTAPLAAPKASVVSATSRWESSCAQPATVVIAGADAALSEMMVANVLSLGHKDKATSWVFVLRNSASALAVTRRRNRLPSGMGSGGSCLRNGCSGSLVVWFIAHSLSPRSVGAFDRRGLAGRGDRAGHRLARDDIHVHQS